MTMMQKPIIIKALNLSSVNVNMFTNVSAKVTVRGANLTAKAYHFVNYFLCLLQRDFTICLCENRRLNFKEIRNKCSKI